jgi:hypothetical protein
MTIVKGGKQDTLALNLASQAQVLWMSYQNSTYDLFWLTIALKGSMDAKTRLVLHQECV